MWRKGEKYEDNTVRQKVGSDEFLLAKPGAGEDTRHSTVLTTQQEEYWGNQL